MSSSFFDDVEALPDLTSMPENGLDSLTQTDPTPFLTVASPAKKQKKTNANGSAEHPCCECQFVSLRLGTLVATSCVHVMRQVQGMRRGRQV
jgi:hypothetical protein